jgi:hypothetical protein
MNAPELVNAGLPVSLLRGHVVRRSHERARLGQRIDARVLNLREPEIGHLDDDEPVFFFEEEVRRLDVAVDDPRGMSRRDAATRLQHERHRDAGLELLHARQELSEVLAAHSRHDEVWRTGRVVDAVIEQREDVLVVKPRGGLDLAIEARARLCRSRRCPGPDEQCLHRDSSAVLVGGLEDHAHSAGAQLGAERVFSAQNSAGRNRGRRRSSHRSELHPTLLMAGPR